MHSLLRLRPLLRVGGVSCLVVAMIAQCDPSVPERDAVATSAAPIVSQATAPERPPTSTGRVVSTRAPTTLATAPTRAPVPASAPPATSLPPVTPAPSTDAVATTISTTVPAPAPTVPVTAAPPPAPTTVEAPATSGPGAPPPPPPPTIAPPPPAAPSSDAVALANEARAGQGLPPLAEHGALTDAARSHSIDQASMQTMTHTGSDGSDAGQRIARAGAPVSTWGENVAAGYGSASGVIGGWMDSPGHRRNILDPAFTAIGVASAQAGDGTIYWTMVLAA